MQNKQKISLCLTVAVGLLALTGCSQGKAAQLANEIHFPVNGISGVTISYDEEPITFYESENDELVIKEYMTENKRSYYAKVEQSSNSIEIHEGGKPLLKSGFSRYIEVYLPASYRDNLTVTTTDGDIDLTEMKAGLHSLKIDSTAGTVQLGDVEAKEVALSSTSGTLDVGDLCADTIRIDSTSGSVSCERLDGDVTYTTTSGNAEIASAVGSGKYTANNSGELHVVYTEVTGDVSFFNKNDSIQVTLPPELEFEFDATTKNGSISTSFSSMLSSDGRTTHGTVGDNPTVTVYVETKNGNIEVNQ